MVTRRPGRPLDATLDHQLLTAAQDLLIEQGFERLTMDAVAKRCGASKATIYRRWPSKTALVVAAAAALFQAPDVPDTGDLREDLLICGRSYIQSDVRTAQVLSSVLTGSRYDPTLRDAARQTVAAPYGGLFAQVLIRAAARGLIRSDADLQIIAQIFPSIAYHRVAAEGQLVIDEDVQRVVDGVLLPAIRI